ncbi:hypothetical protein EIN_430820 [Entamoeba invadens IP1]|uniref:BAR domain-containing protein n=1 Tax=Entamoeba invadens IP1 TaxID=370355 RepID=A0A0A1UF87_ENTIV|nr:hypothetical protein EIN_430820 [Entamoeba invadens IP1]ELP95276.1 hypothetical protein EIN_430820 [Entamoeba invadens IP1]|eukprot:XP_004262047.1 hypothetical protein EIN_430820 [Entamoeba invadens IP1]
MLQSNTLTSQNKKADEWIADSDSTYAAINNVIPRFKTIVDACNSYVKANQQMIKAAEVLVASMEDMGDCGHQDLNVGMLNVANMFSMWKNNLIEIADQFKQTSTSLLEDVTALPKDLNRLVESSKKHKAKANDEWKKAMKKVESTKKNKKLMKNNPDMLKTCEEDEEKKREEYRCACIAECRDALTMLRGCYGNMFDKFKHIYDVKVNADTKSQQIFNAQLKDINALINVTKVIPGKCNTLYSMLGNKFIDEASFKNEAKELLTEVGINKYALEHDDLVTKLIEDVKTGVENGNFTTDYVQMMLKSVPESYMQPPAEERIDDILEPTDDKSKNSEMKSEGDNKEKRETKELKTAKSMTNSSVTKQPNQKISV